MLRLFIRLDRLRANPELLLAGDAPLGERCRPALMAAAAWRDEREGDLGEGGLGRELASLMEILLGRGCSGDAGPEGGREAGSEFRSGGIMMT